MQTRLLAVAGLALPLALAACARKEEPKVVYQAVPVERRDIMVSAQASGTIRPDTVVEVKSRASGEVLQVFVESGQLVRKGDRLVAIDPRFPKNAMDQAQAELDVAQAQLANATTQKQRADELLKSQSITQAEQETAALAYANAKAAVVRARVAVENARINLEDTDVRAPITGTIIEKAVERGQQIASATQNVGGGTLILKMADLSLVQAVTLVDETDIGKVKPGMRASVTVDAYPNRPFEGTVLKIEPSDTTVQNVTMFPVRVRIDNRDGLLLPGMNAEVAISIGERRGVLAVPSVALRTERDMASAAQVLGLDVERVRQQLAEARGKAAPAPAAGGDSARSASLGGAARADSAAPAKPAGNVMTTPDGRQVTLPPGVTEQQVRDIFRKRFSGGELTARETEIMGQVRRAMQAAGAGRPGGRPRPPTANYQFGGDYVVFVKRGADFVATPVRTGLTDLDYSEVVSGLQEGDSVMVLPSAGLVQSQTEFRNRFSQMTGGGLGGMRQQQPQGGAAAGQGGAAGGAGAARPQGRP